MQQLAMQCDYGQIYLSCGPICQKTCFSDDSDSCPQNICVEGWHLWLNVVKEKGLQEI